MANMTVTGAAPVQPTAPRHQAVAPAPVPAAAMPSDSLHPLTGKTKAHVLDLSDPAVKTVGYGALAFGVGYPAGLLIGAANKKLAARAALRAAVQPEAAARAGGNNLMLYIGLGVFGLMLLRYATQDNH